MNFVRAFVSPSPARQGGLQALREYFLSAVLIVASVLAAPLYATLMFSLVRSGQWHWAAIYTAAYVWGILITLVRRLPFRVRAASLLLILYAVGLADLLGNGLSGNGRIFLLALPILAAVLWDVRLGLAALGLSVITLIALGGLMVGGRLPLPPLQNMVNAGDTTAWVLAVLVILLLGAIVTVYVGFLMSWLDQSLHSERSLAAELEAQRAHLEQNVRQRTRDLERRLRQIHAGAEIARAVGTIRDPQALLDRVVGLIRERFDLYYAGVFVIDEAGEYAVLRAGTGEAGAALLAAGHKLAVGGQSMIGWACANRRPRIALDTGAEPARFDNPYLPRTRSELALPLVIGDRALGALTIQSEQPAAFDDDDITALQGMADQIAIALENARLFQQTEASLREVSALHRQYLSEAWAEAKQEMPVSAVEFDATSGLVLPVSPVHEPAPLTPNVSAISAPLVLREQVIGALTLEAEGREWTPDERVLVEAVAAQAALALENARLLEETRRRAYEAETLRQAGAVVAASLRREEAIPRLLEQLQRVVPYDSATVMLYDGECLEIVGGSGWADSRSVLGIRFPVPGDNPNTVVIQERRPHILSDAPAVYPAFREEPHSHIRSWLGVPLVARDRVMGMIALDSKQVNFYTEDHARLAGAFADHVASALENARLLQETERALADTRRRAERDQMLAAIADRLHAATDVTAVLRIAAEEMRRATGSARAVVRLKPESVDAGSRPSD